MASAAGQKPMILTAAKADLKRADAKARLAESQVKEAVPRSNFLMVFAAAALLLSAVGYMLFNSNWNTMMLFPIVSDTVPSPDINATVAPPPADAPAANP